jgi:pseudouridine-5'-phosphate glycosidase
MQPLLRIHPAVQLALDQDRPVVALESTIIAHGMPWPRNHETALRLEAAVRESGAQPATVAVLDGTLRVGLEADELERLAREGGRVAKVSRRDLPFLLARGETGATTVAGTLIAAHMAGIAVFATGGIGGVHRGWQQTGDVSADLPELARSPVAVVCSGAKSILDLGATRERLETYGVPVVGYRTDVLPAFYTRDSGFPVDYRVDEPEDWARAFLIQRRLGLEGGMVVANPVPEDREADFHRMETVTREALAEADAQGLRGAALTPFLLRRIAERSGGESLEANVALAEHNAALAGHLAVALAGLDGLERG